MNTTGGKNKEPVEIFFEKKKTKRGYSEQEKNKRKTTTDVAKGINGFIYR